MVHCIGMLIGKRGIKAPAICPNCEIIVRPIFLEGNLDKDNPPRTDIQALIEAIIECVNAGAKIINLSIGLNSSSQISISELYDVYNYALERNVILVIAAGNQGILGYNLLINHPWVIPVTSCDEFGNFVLGSNLGLSIKKYGVMAPGINISSTFPNNRYGYMSGTSVAAPFVTGALALLWTLFPKINAQDLRYSIVHSLDHQKNTIMPNLLNVESSIAILKNLYN